MKKEEEGIGVHSQLRTKIIIIKKSLCIHMQKKCIAFSSFFYSRTS